MIFIPEADIRFSLIITDIQFTVLAVIRFEHEISWKNAQFLSERFLKEQILVTSLSFIPLLVFNCAIKWTSNSFRRHLNEINFSFKNSICFIH